MYTTTELAERANITRSRARQLCLAGRVDARKLGRDWLISVESAERWMRSDARRRFGPREYRERYADEPEAEPEKRRRFWPFGD